MSSQLGHKRAMWPNPDVYLIIIFVNFEFHENLFSRIVPTIVLDISTKEIRIWTSLACYKKFAHFNWPIAGPHHRASETGQTCPVLYPLPQDKLAKLRYSVLRDSSQDHFNFCVVLPLSNFTSALSCIFLSISN